MASECLMVTQVEPRHSGVIDGFCAPGDGSKFGKDTVAINNYSSFDALGDGR